MLGLVETMLLINDRYQTYYIFFRDICYSVTWFNKFRKEHKNVKVKYQVPRDLLYWPITLHFEQRFHCLQCSQFYILLVHLFTLIIHCHDI